MDYLAIAFIVLLVLVILMGAYLVRRWGRHTVVASPPDAYPQSAAIPADAGARTIVAPTQLDPQTWGTSGAARSDPAVTICPALYGSFHNGHVYEWAGGKVGKKIGEIERIDATSQTTTITWRAGTESLNTVTVEAVSGCGSYAGTDGRAGWETGTIFGRGAPTAPTPSRFAHIYQVTPDWNRRSMWEAIAPAGMSTADCMSELERVVRTGATDTKLTVSFITADRVHVGGIPTPAGKN